MKYRFITILHNMKLDTIKNRGTRIFDSARISNGREALSEVFETRLFQDTAGTHSIDEFKDTVYFYIDGEFEDITTQEEMDKKGVEFTFLFLRQAQEFAMELWKIKDNNIYVRDGFLLTYNSEIEEGRTFKASLSEMPTYATGNGGISNFSNEEIMLATNDFVPLSVEDLGEDSVGGKYPSSSHFFKSSGSERIDRATYFTMAARNNSTLPMKIVSYCTALECLFTSGNSGVSHRIAERVAAMLGTSGEEKKDLFKLVKKAYGHRSTIIHGSSLKGNDEGLIDLSLGLDEILRDLIVAEHEIFSKNDGEIEDYFLDLLFTNTSAL